MQIFLSLMIAACSSPSSLTPDDAGPIDASSSDTDDASSTDADDAGSTDADCDPSITYSAFGMNFFATYCNRCHAWDQQQAQSGVGSEISYIAGQTVNMPPVAPFPTDAERLELVQWIACGAP